jgi:hypothetical protein
MTTLTTPDSVGDIESFVAMLRAARSDRSVRARLERLLSLPDEQRASVVHSWVGDLLIAEAPRDFVFAVACLQDKQVAGRASEVIRDCEQSARAARRLSACLFLAAGIFVSLMLIV